MAVYRVHFMGHIDVPAVNKETAMAYALRLLGLEDDVFDVDGVSNIIEIEPNPNETNG